MSARQGFAKVIDGTQAVRFSSFPSTYLCVYVCVLEHAMTRHVEIEDDTQKSVLSHYVDHESQTQMVRLGS